MARLRPLLHFTPDVGWMNDPHGLVWDGSTYHLYYQANPNSLKWAQPIEWGHAVSSDLIAWRDLGISLPVAPDESGCWSGSVVVDDEGKAQLFYTRPKTDDWQHGQVVAATGEAGWHSWQRWPGSPLVDGPAATGLDLFDFRDPQVRRQGDGWRMVVGAGLRGSGGAAVQYRSDDLRHWEFDSLLATRPAGGELDTGTIWECPQFFEVDGRWVLLFSAMDGHALSRVMYAIGNYDGQQFTPEHWGIFEPTGTAYATTTFRDSEGRPCSMSWLKESGDVREGDGEWAGAQSLVTTLKIAGERLMASPHPALNAHFIARLPFQQSIETQVGRAFYLELEVGGAQSFSIETGNWSLAFADGVLRVAGTNDARLSALNLPHPIAKVTVFVDADLCEVFIDGSPGFIAFHVPAAEANSLKVNAAEGTLAAI